MNEEELIRHIKKGERIYQDSYIENETEKVQQALMDECINSWNENKKEFYSEINLELENIKNSFAAITDKYQKLLVRNSQDFHSHFIDDISETEIFETIMDPGFGNTFTKYESALQDETGNLFEEALAFLDDRGQEGELIKILISGATI